MIVGIDHIVILVRDLEAAQADYSRLGFTVLPGGAHADGATHNALIVFADGTYLELLAFLREAPEHRWWRHVAHGEGLIDWALLPDAIADDIATARAHGVDLEGPVAGGRRRPDGQEVAWQMGLPATPDLPFLCGDVTPRALRVPEGADVRQHANGVVGIAGLTVAVRDITTSVQRYRGLLTTEMHSPGGPSHAVPPTSPVVPEPGARVALLPAGQATVSLVAPAPAATDDPHAYPLHAHLAQRGEGPYALALRVEDAAQQTTLDTTQTHGVPLQLVVTP
jgi:catechol 2,3-dioxygenase-like lactoylglutathione lyase family enzyme